MKRGDEGGEVNPSAPLLKPPSAIPPFTSATNQDYKSRRQVGTPPLLRRRPVRAKGESEEARAAMREGEAERDVCERDNAVLRK